MESNLKILYNPPMIIDFILFAITGAIAGTAAGLLGIGGGMIVVPCLAFVFTHTGLAPESIMHTASATSLAAMVFTASMSTYSHNKREAVLWSIFRRLLPGIIIGTVLGMFLASTLSTEVLKIIFAIFLLLIAIRMFLNYKPKVARGLPGSLSKFGIAMAIGGKSGLLGVGGGALMVPFLIHCNIPIRKAAGTSAACGLPIAIAGTLSAIITGWHVDPGELYTFGYVFWPAALIIAIFSMSFVFLGAKLSHVLPVNTIRRVFAVVLLLAAINLFY